jgi:hypothetical protein
LREGRSRRFSVVGELSFLHRHSLRKSLVQSLILALGLPFLPQGLFDPRIVPFVAFLGGSGAVSFGQRCLRARSARGVAVGAEKIAVLACVSAAMDRQFAWFHLFLNKSGKCEKYDLSTIKF